MFVFVLGTGRCGSTLAHEILARHPDVGFVSNLEDNLSNLDRSRGRWNSALYRHVPPALTQKGRLRYAPSEGYNLLDRSVSPLLSMPFRDLVADDVTPWLDGRFRRFFEERALVQGRKVFSHKFTGWPRARFVHRIMPEARFINVVRDGRAVANSWLQMDWWLGYRGPDNWHWGSLPPAYAQEWEASGRSHVVLAGIAWKILVDAFEEARDELRTAQWLDLRYEDLVQDPRSTYERIFDFIGLEWNDEFERGFAEHRLSSARSEAFRADLGPEHVETLDLSLGGHLARWGYGDTAGPEPVVPDGTRR